MEWRVTLGLVVAILGLVWPVQAQFFTWMYRSHATDCTAITDGKNTELCFEVDSNRLFKCEPTAGDCDTPAEWKLVGVGFTTSADLATALTDEVGSAGGGLAVFNKNTPFTGQTEFAAGSASAPSITTTGDLNTGMWFPAADTIGFSGAGVELLRVSTSEILAKVHIRLGANIALTGSDGSGNSVGAIFQLYNNDVYFDSPVAGGKSIFRTSGTNERMRIDNLGNVGIFDTTPDAKLDVVNSSASQPIARFEAAATPTANLLEVDFNAGTTGAVFKITSAGRGVFGQGLFTITPLATAPATCAIGDFYVDTSGAYCVCTAVNTWEKVTTGGANPGACT